eukprot:752237-Hanusia_phi.AAC.2
MLRRGHRGEVDVEGGAGKPFHDDEGGGMEMNAPANFGMRAMDGGVQVQGTSLLPPRPLPLPPCPPLSLLVLSLSFLFLFIPDHSHCWSIDDESP